MADYSGKTVEELQAMKQELDTRIEVLYAQKREIAAAENTKLVEDAARRRLETMSDEEKATLVQIIQAEGIHSQENLGNI